jgi:hypothetical protein
VRGRGMQVCGQLPGECVDPRRDDADVERGAVRVGADYVAFIPGSASGTLTVSGFGNTATRVVLVAAIADKPGVQVAFDSGASVSGTIASK